MADKLNNLIASLHATSLSPRVSAQTALAFGSFARLHHTSAVEQDKMRYLVLNATTAISMFSPCHHFCNMYTYTRTHVTSYRCHVTSYRCTCDIVQVDSP